MKLILQIALGVFLGTLASQLTHDVWRARLDSIAKQAAQKMLAEQERIRLEQGERIRAIFSQARKRINPPTGFVPDDALTDKRQEKSD